MNETDITYYIPDSSVTVREVQDVLLEILIEFDTICREHDLRYSLYGGTLLGAVRHGGFIPWDDDVDVVMPRADYDEFLAIAARDLDERFFISNHMTEEESCLLFTKMRRNGSRMVQPSYAGSDQHHGMFIDIFPLDVIEPGTPRGDAHLKSTWRHFILTTSTNKARTKYVSSRINGILRTLLYNLTRMMGKDRIFENAEAEIQKLNETVDPDPVLGDLTNGMSPANITKAAYRLSEFNSLVEIDFEGHPFLTVADYEGYLTREYGDYMQLPPMEQRVAAHSTPDIVFPDRA